MLWSLIYGIVTGLIDSKSAAHPCDWNVSFQGMPPVVGF